MLANVVGRQQGFKHHICLSFHAFHFMPHAPLRTMVERASSVTHEHLLGILSTEIGVRGVAPGVVVRILDAGCGNGVLLEYLARSLPALHPELDFEFHGFDVDDQGVQTRADFFDVALRRLEERLPEHPWRERLALISHTADWPYPDDFFDAIVSNQVLEHVHDHDAFLAQVERTLRTGGVSAHLFPLRHYVYETHLNLPLVHRVRGHDALVAYIRLLSRLGLGKYREIHRATGMGIGEYAERHADYIHYFTHYRDADELLRIAKRHRLRASFRYTGEFYTAKLRQLLGRPVRTRYRARRSALADSLAALVLRYVSGVTFFLEKREHYTSR